MIMKLWEREKIDHMKYSNDDFYGRFAHVLGHQEINETTENLKNSRKKGTDDEEWLCFYATDISLNFYLNFSSIK